jgi:hypothetical protein
MECMTEGAAHNDRLLTASEFFSRARKRLTFDVPAGLTDPNVIPRHDELDADPAIIIAIAAVRPIKPAAVLVPIIERDELSVLFTQRTAHLADHPGQISFPGGTPQNHKRERRDWNGFTLGLYAMQFGGRNIWGATAGILRNLYEQVYRE